MLAETIRDPLIVLKLCAPDAVFRAFLPPDWSIGPASYVMTRDGQALKVTTLPSGYRLEVREDGLTIVAEILSENNFLAASGRAVEHGGIFIYDQIVIDPAHRRRGLGRVLMTELAARRRHKTSQQILVATSDGRALYKSLRWQDLSPYFTATLTSGD